MEPEEKRGGLLLIRQSHRDLYDLFKQRVGRVGDLYRAGMAILGPTGVGKVNRVS